MHGWPIDFRAKKRIKYKKKLIKKGRRKKTCFRTYRWENLVNIFFGAAQKLGRVGSSASAAHEHALLSHVRLLAHLMNHPAALFYIDNEGTWSTGV